MDDKNKYTYQVIKYILTTGKDPDNPDQYYTQQELHELVTWLNGNINPDNQEITLPSKEEVIEQKVEIASQAVDLNENTPADKKQAAWEQVLHHNEVLSQTGAPPIPTQVVSQEVSRRATELASKTLSPEIKGKIGELLNKIPQIPDVESVVKKKAAQGLSTRIAVRLGLASLGAAASAGVYLLVEAGFIILNKAKDLLRSGLIKLTGDGDGSNLASVSLGAAALGILFPPAFALALVTGGLSYLQGGTEGFKKAGKKGALLIFAILGAFFSIVIWPIVITLITVPVLIAFTILVITNSSYVVPPGDMLFSSSGGIGGKYAMCWPTKGRITQGPNPDHKTLYSSGNAIDIAQIGAGVFATHDGMAVPYCFGPDPNGWGTYICVQGEEFTTLYAHLSILAITSPTPILAGRQLGVQGWTGNVYPPGVNGTHLHYEVIGTSPRIQDIVPDYVLYTQATGCFAEDSGGSDEPIDPASKPPAPEPVEPADPDISNPPAACPGVCRPLGDPTCIPETLPEGSPDWDCPASAPQCCMEGFDAG